MIKPLNKPGLAFRLRTALAPGSRPQLLLRLSPAQRARELVRLSSQPEVIVRLLETAPEVFTGLGPDLSRVAVALAENGSVNQQVVIGSHSGLSYPGSGSNEIVLTPFYRKLFPEPAGQGPEFDRALIGWGSFIVCEKNGRPVETSVLEIFGRLLRQEQVPVERLLKSLEHCDPKVREFFVAVLAKLGDKRALPPLRQILAASDDGRIDAEYHVRKAAIFALVEICARDTGNEISLQEKQGLVEALKGLVQRQVDSQDTFKWYLTPTAVWALGQLADKRDDDLMKLLGDVLILRLRLESDDVRWSGGRTDEKKTASMVLAQFGADGSMRATMILEYVANELSDWEGYSQEEVQRDAAAVRKVNEAAKELARQALTWIASGVHPQTGSPYRDV